MDKMRPYEVNDCLKNIKYVDKTYRELERFYSYVYLQSNTKKQLKPKDIMELPWDIDEFKEKPEYNEEEEKELEQKAERLKYMIKNFNVKTETANLL